MDKLANTGLKMLVINIKLSTFFIIKLVILSLKVKAINF